MLFLTNLSVRKQNVKTLIEYGRKRWYIENQEFHTQKRQGYFLEHMYSKNYHYYLIQIGHMISQVLEAWEVLWKEVRLSREQKHRRILESWKTEDLYEYEEILKERRQIRLQEG